MLPCEIHGPSCHYYHCKTSHVIPGSLDSWLDGESPETKEIWTTKVKINGDGIDIPKDVRLTDSMVRRWWNYKVPTVPERTIVGKLCRALIYNHHLFALQQRQAANIAAWQRTDNED